MIVPTVGRVVLYYPGDDIRARRAPYQPNDQPWKADVTYVWNDRLVNLMVVTPDGTPFGVINATLVQEGDAIPNGSYCTWMAWQLGQAKAFSHEK